MGWKDIHQYVGSGCPWGVELQKSFNFLLFAYLYHQIILQYHFFHKKNNKKDVIFTNTQCKITPRIPGS
jgi:hypothetical protein